MVRQRGQDKQTITGPYQTPLKCPELTTTRHVAKQWTGADRRAGWLTAYNTFQHCFFQTGDSHLVHLSLHSSDGIETQHILSMDLAYGTCPRGITPCPPPTSLPSENPSVSEQGAGLQQEALGIHPHRVE